MAAMLPWYEGMWDAEEVWSDDPDDPGGETYRGISYQYHGDDVIWDLIKKHLEHPDFPEVLDGDSFIRHRHMKFCREHYWEMVFGDDYPDEVHLIPEILCDVRHGMADRWRVVVGQAMQAAINRHKPDEEQPLILDGRPGPVTLALLNRALLMPGWGTAYVEAVTQMVYARVECYAKIVDRDPHKTKFLRRWLRRSLAPLDRLIAECEIRPPIADPTLPIGQPPA